MRTLLLKRVLASAALFALVASPAFAVPLTGVKNIPGDYATLTAAIADLNLAGNGVGVGGVTLNVLAGNPQTAPAGGYIIGGTGSAVLTTSSSTQQITIQGNGNTIQAFTPQTASSIADAVFKLVGADWVTITGCIIQENPANANVGSPSPTGNNMTELGVGLFYVSTTDGAQNNTIQGNTITLNRAYQNTFGIYSNTRHTSTNMTTLAEATTAAGANSNNKFYSNNISNVNYGVILVGCGTNLAAVGTGNDVGGASPATGNTITNWGGNTTAISSYVSVSGNLFCIYDNMQINENVANNIITSAAWTVANTGGGIFKNYSVATPTVANVGTINNNTITVTNNPSSATAGGIIGIISQNLTPLQAAATISITNNTIQNCVIGGSTSTTNGITGISSPSVPGTSNITGNIVQNNSVAATTATTGGITAIINTGAATTVNMNNNSVIGNSLTSPVATTAILAGLANAAAAGTLNINNNVVRNQSSTAASGQNQGVNISGAVTTAINVNGNQFGNASGGFFTSSVASSGVNFGVVTSGGTSACALSIQNNDIRGIVYNVPATSSVALLQNTAATRSQNISNNTYTNLNLNTSGSLIMVANGVALSSTGTMNIDNNQIVGSLTKAAGGTVQFYSTVALSVAGSTKSIQNNNLSNINLSGATAFVGIDDEDGNSTSSAPVKTISGNTIKNISNATGGLFPMFVDWSGPNSIVSNNTIANITWSGTAAITGLTIGTSNQATINVSGNVVDPISSAGAVTGISNAAIAASLSGNSVFGLSTSAAAAVTGIANTGGTTASIVKNKVYDLSGSNAGSTVNGILLSGGTTVTTTNNLVGNLTAPAANAADVVRGISVTSTTLASTYNVYFNTINLSGNSSGALFGTSGIFHAASAVATTAALNLRNNIVNNLSIPSGAGTAVALRRSAAALNNFAATSNNNLLYAGSPGASNLIYDDGASPTQTLAAYKALVAPRDANAVTENPPFLTTVGANAGFLHINPAIPTQVESGAATIVGVTDDYDGDLRAATPDIGADEGNFKFVTTTSLTSDVNPSNCGSKVNLTATVTPSNSTGTVEFFDGATSLGTSPVSGGQATLSVTSFTVGAHSLTAVYSGDTNHGASTSPVYTQTVNSISTTTSLTSDVNPSFVGGKVNLSATVNPAAATGTVEFFDGATSLGTAPVNAGVATLSVNFSGAGKHNLTATYGGSACYTGSTSAQYSQQVDLNPTTTTLTSDVNPSNCGDKVNLTATVSALSATGTVEFFDGATSLGTSPVSNGVATLSVTSFTVGAHSLTATYSGDGTYATSTSAPYSQTVNVVATSTILTAVPNPSAVNQKVNLFANVSPSSATGSVDFYDGATLLGSGPVISGQATLSVFFTTTGKHTLTATYNGDGCHTGSTSAPYSQVVNALASTTTLTSDVNPSDCGGKVNLTATVDPNIATGTVEFFDGATSLGTAPVSGGIATLSVSNLSVGTHSLKATYSGDGTYGGSTSPTYSQTVNAIPTTTSLSSDVNPSFVGGKVNLTATVAPAAATGSVEFFDGATSLGTAPISGGIATLSVFFNSAGKHNLTATSTVDACHSGSTSAQYSQTVNLNPSTTSLTSDVNPSSCGQKVNLTATVAPAAATGTVEFFDGATSLGTAPVSGGIATLSVSSLSVGTHSLTATYGGDATYASSTSAPYSQTVNPVASSTNLTSDVNPSLVGGKVNLTATVTPSGATGTVQFFDGANPLGSAPVVSGVATLSVNFNTAGKHVLTANYGGDGCNSPSASAPYSQVVNLNPSSTSLTSDVNPSTCGDKVNLTATVAPAAATGTVEFFDGATSLGTAPVAGGIATLSVSTLAVGGHNLTATYSGDNTYAGSTSAPYVQVVNPRATTTVLTSDVGPNVPVNSKVNLTATISPSPVTGTVEFFDGATSLGTAPVTNDFATLSVIFTTTGKHVLTSVYGGDGCHAGSTSAPLSLTVEPPVAVLLSLFEANTVNDGIELRWQFSDLSEVSTTWLERSPSANGPWTRVDLQTRETDGISVAVDNSVDANAIYNYRLVVAFNVGGTQTFSPIDGRAGSKVTEFALAKISPNPMRHAAIIEYTVAKEANISIRIVDLQGRVVANVANGVKAAGRYTATWNRTSVPAGVYFVRYQTPGKVTTKRIVLQ